MHFVGGGRLKALLREKGETVTEEMRIPGIDWKTGAPLTNPKWFGGPYTLVQNYVPQVNDVPAQYEEVVKPEQVEIEDKDDYVVIDGKRYSKEELRSLLK